MIEASATRITETLTKTGRGLGVVMDDKFTMVVIEDTSIEPSSIEGRFLTSIVALADWALQNGATLDGARASFPPKVVNSDMKTVADAIVRLSEGQVGHP